MNKIGIWLFLFLCCATVNALAQSPVPNPAGNIPDTLETLEQSEAYKAHIAGTAAMKADAQKQLDSLFNNHEQIIGTTKAEALKDWEAAKIENTNTLKALREEEMELRKELEKAQQKSNNGLKTRLRHSFNKTKYEVEEAE